MSDDCGLECRAYGTGCEIGIAGLLAERTTVSQRHLQERAASQCPEHATGLRDNGCATMRATTQWPIQEKTLYNIVTSTLTH